MVIIVKVTVGQPQSLEHGYYSKSNGRPSLSRYYMVIIVKVTVGPASVVITWLLVKVTVGQSQSLEHGYYSKSNGRPASVVRTWLL